MHAIEDYLRQAAEAAMKQSFEEDLPVPWNHESPLTRELLVDADPNGKCRFHCIDPWHCIHLGVGKTWTACGVMMIQRLIPESNMDKRIAIIAEEYKSFCKRNKLDPVIRKIDVHTFNSTTEPIGTWSKAGVTSNWMMFLQEFYERNMEEVQKDECLLNFVTYQHFLLIYILMAKLFLFSTCFVYNCFSMFLWGAGCATVPLSSHVITRPHVLM